MDPPHGCRPWRPCLLHHPHHHLHHHHPLFLCPHHHYHHHLHHQNNRNLFNCHVHTNFAPFPQNPEHSAAAAAAIPFQTHSISETSGALQEQQKHGEIGDVVGFEEEEEEDDDPVFVLTDEWKEFFAKSEAKRRLEKQQAKKKRKG
ncbi:PREDICTED: SKI/DACH domain-containing [Prunus dulcis]|uniref:PREDICTED: SKI/DACH domain-containing n=1 Tax=Prunus dulcis TaxID=3755 RepID=A0A5E4ELI8_PRUDU|nr:SKI/DACH domain-containing protein 1-like [Prunus dulcis]VVA15769.1 PREDICTED: SKI/DACH domain-containing [Prunus dulcis]